MTFLESLLGINLDGGNGFIEFLLLLVPLTGIMLLRVKHLRRRRI